MTTQCSHEQWCPPKAVLWFNLDIMFCKKQLHHYVQILILSSSLTTDWCPIPMIADSGVSPSLSFESTSVSHCARNSLTTLLCPCSAAFYSGVFLWLSLGFTSILWCTRSSCTTGTTYCPLYIAFHSSCTTTLCPPYHMALDNGILPNHLLSSSQHRPVWKVASPSLHVLLLWQLIVASFHHCHLNSPQHHVVWEVATPPLYVHCTWLLTMLWTVVSFHLKELQHHTHDGIFCFPHGHDVPNERWHNQVVQFSWVPVQLPVRHAQVTGHICEASRDNAQLSMWKQRCLSDLKIFLCRCDLPKLNRTVHSNWVTHEQDRWCYSSHQYDHQTSTYRSQN